VRDADDEIRTLRSRVDDLAARLGSALDRDRSDSPSVLGKTFALSVYPTAAGRFYAMHPVALSGTPSEGATPTVTVGTTYFYAYNLGSAIPPAGTTVVCRRASRRWLFRYDG
jgi:hypothetical protein